MSNPKIFDVLVVYSGDLAASASATQTRVNRPFLPRSQREDYNQVYAYFLTTCASKGLEAAFTTSKDIIGPGTCKSYWIFKDSYWEKVNQPCFSTNIFDKFSPTSKLKQIKRDILFSSPIIKAFNKKSLLFFVDKLKTYKILKEFAIPTVSIKSPSPRHIKKAMVKLNNLISQHTNYQDFGIGYVLKDRLGAGGNNIFKITDNYLHSIKNILEHNQKEKFILQPFVKFDQGYQFNGKLAPTDIRLIYMDSQIVQTYLRTAKKGDFRCNQHQGGTLQYVSADKIRPDVLEVSQDIVDQIDSDHALYALDFIVSNNGNPYFLEGNNTPGLSWEGKIDEQKAKQLTNLIIDELKLRA